MEAEDGAELCFPEFSNASCKKPIPPRSEAVFLYVVLSSLSVLAAALNQLVIVSVSHFRRLHTPTNILLLSLAVSDFLTGFLVIPGKIVIQKACWFLHDVLCTLSYSFSFMLVSASVGVMVLISVDRYLAICDPLHYSTRVTERRVKVCVCVCWFCSILYGILIVKDNLTHPGRHKSCYGECVIVVDYLTGTIDLFLSFIIPVSVIVVLYMRVFVVAVSQARAMRSHVTAILMTVTAKKSELKAARNLGVLVVVFLMCFCPYYCASLAGQNTLQSSTVSFLVDLLYFNSCINPLIYALLYPWFRKAVKLIVTLQILQPGSCDTNIL